MERRKFVIGLGSLAAGGAAAMGTGAFTTAEVERSVAVNVKGDDAAYVRLAPASGPNGDYARVEADGDDDAKLAEVDFNNTEDFPTAGSANEGVNENSKFTFESVLNVQNEGTQPVKISLDGLDGTSGVGQSASTLLSNLTDPSDGDVSVAATLDDDAGDATIGVGESIDIDFAIKVGKNMTDDAEFSQSLDIIADADAAASAQ